MCSHRATSDLVSLGAPLATAFFWISGLEFARIREPRQITSNSVSCPRISFRRFPLRAGHGIVAIRRILENTKRTLLPSGKAIGVDHRCASRSEMR